MELSRDMNTVGGTGTSGNCSAASAKVANEPAICVSGLRVILNAWNRRFTVDLSGTRPRHSKSEFLSILHGAGCGLPGHGESAGGVYQPHKD